MFVKNNSKSLKWLPGSVVKQTGPVSCKITLQNGKTIRCHQDQLIKRDTDDLAMTKEPPVLTDDDLTMFTGNNNTPEDSTQVHIERRYPFRQRPPDNQ